MIIKSLLQIQVKHRARGPRAFCKDVFQAQLSLAILGQMVPMSCMCEEVNRGREFILMNRDKGSLGTEAAAGF